MNIHITGRHVDITQGMRNYITESFSHLKKLLAHVPDNSIDAHVVLIVEHGMAIAEVTMHIAQQPTVHAKADAGDMYTATDILVDRVKAQLWKHKDKELTERDNPKHIIAEDEDA